MRQLDLTVFEPGDTIGTLSADGQVQVWRVATGGSIVPAGAVFSLPSTSESIDSLDLTVRTYNLLKREGVSTIAEMLNLYASKGPEGLLDLRNFGQRSVDEVAGWVARLNGFGS